MLRSPRRLVCLAALTAALSGAVHAEGLYLGGNLGVPHWLNSANGVSGSSAGTGLNLYGGYQFWPDVAVELGYASLGSLSGNGVSARARTGYVDLVGQIQDGNGWAGLLRLGYAAGTISTSQGDGSAAGLKLGLGLQYELTPQIALRGEWSRYHLSSFSSHTGIDQYSIGLKYGF
jgi:OmpA-OmpF porin, OOP family